MIQQVAKKEHDRMQTIEQEDIEQALWEFFCEKINHVRGWEAAGIRDLANKVARHYVQTERIDYMYFSGNFVYTPAQVEELLTEAVWREVEEVPDMDGRVDVMREFNNLAIHDKDGRLSETSLKRQRLLFRKYGLGESYPKYTTEGKMIDRTVDRITHKLNMAVKQERMDVTNAE